MLGYRSFDPLTAAYTKGSVSRPKEALSRLERPVSYILTVYDRNRIAYLLTINIMFAHVV